jgi:DNA-binding response OmpR family regulator
MRKKILVADDDEAGRLLLSRILSSAGYEIIQAENGEQALELFRKQKPDLIITDMNMPVMDGFDLAGIIREDPDSAHIPIIFISAMYKDVESKVRAMDIGGNEYLTQPLDRDELLYKVKAMMNCSGHEGR